MTILTAIGEELHSNEVLEVGYDLAATYDEQLVVLHVIPKEDFNEHRAALEGASASDNFTISREEQAPPTSSVRPSTSRSTSTTPIGSKPRGASAIRPTRYCP